VVTSDFKIWGNLLGTLSYLGKIRAKIRRANSSNLGFKG